nr:heavy metal-binding domain-containing protein [uncultured Nocardioides sp.]
MASHQQEPKPTTARQVTDPVCGMMVDPATTEHAAVHDGEHFSFCSGGCEDEFLTAPDAYPRQPGEQDHTGHDTQQPHHGHHVAGGDQLTAPTPAAGEAVEYTCPMHPEIRQDGPGTCPICGMALEPVIVTADTGPSAELRDMTRRFWFGVVLSVPVLVLGMGRDLIPWLHDNISATTSAWVQLVLATPVVLWAGGPFFVRG